jgi:regulator of protease activity HflC (stomatin/prohibitin superfamily)
MFKTITIAQDQRGLLFRRGSYVKLLQPGRYRLLTFADEHVVLQNIMQPFHVEDKDPELFLHDPELVRELEVIRVEDHELALHYENGRFVSVLGAGTHAFWNAVKRHTFTRVDLRQPELPDTIDAAVRSRLTGWLHVFDVAHHEAGVLYYDNVQVRELKPGRYFFWKGPTSVQVKTVDLRQQQLDMTGQEMMTEDKVTLRLNFVCQYRVLDPLRVLEIKSFDEQLYIQLQLILREYVGTLKLDDLLKMKREIGAFVLTRLNERSPEYGVRFLSAGVKDIILPGDVRDILNTVLIAEKQAQANLITRREETASTRSLLNTAKLMDENQTLYRLKELEFLEKICDKIGTISLSGSNNLLEQLNALLGAKAK